MEISSIFIAKSFYSLGLYLKEKLSPFDKVFTYELHSKKLIMDHLNRLCGIFSVH